MHKKFIIQHQLTDTAVTRFQYLIDFINAHPLKPSGLNLVVNNNAIDKDLFYGKERGDFLRIPIDACFLDEAKTVNLFYPTAFSYLEKYDFFAASNQKLAGGSFFNNNIFGFDIFNTLFFHISRYEEYHASSEKNGQAGWLKEDQHFLIKNNLYEIPVVDQLLTIFFEIITQTKINQKSTYAISHDVDILTRFTPGYKFFRSLGATVLHRRGCSQFQDSIAYYKKMSQKGLEDPYDYFDKLLRPEEQWIYKKIYLMTGGNTKYDNKYKIDEPRAQQIINLAKDRGYSIGLHPSYNAGFEADRFESEQKKLESSCDENIIDNRQHWLRWSWKITPYLFEKNGISTDSTMGFNRYLGFRCGTGFPYRLYDFKNNKAFSWIEHPMAFMESSAIHLTHRTSKNLTELMRCFLLKNKENTHLMLNFHNSNFDPLLATGRQLRHFYEKELLALCHG